jgi:hypothetical protein
MAKPPPHPEDKCARPNCGHSRAHHVDGPCHEGCHYLHRLTGKHEPTCEAKCGGFVEAARS